jgi:hypothetical protein
MHVIAAVREAEPWTASGIVGGIALLVVVVLGLAWAIRRYLRS